MAAATSVRTARVIIVLSSSSGVMGKAGGTGGEQTAPPPSRRRLFSETSAKDASGRVPISRYYRLGKSIATRGAASARPGREGPRIDAGRAAQGVNHSTSPRGMRVAQRNGNQQ